MGVDNFGGAYSATSHIIGNGRQRIALFKISPSFLSSVREREAGYRNALKKNGSRVNTKLIREIKFDNIRDQVKEELHDLLQDPHRIDGLFSVNNNITIACLEVLRDMKIKVPEDLAIVSFDDIELFHLSNPTVTAIAQPLERIGEEAVAILLDEIDHRGKRGFISKVLPVAVIERESCGKPLDNFTGLRRLREELVGPLP